MGMPQLVVTAVLVEGRSKSEVARDYGVSRRWVVTLVQRYLAEGEAGLRPRPRRPLHSPGRTAQDIEDEIVALRKELERDGHEAGAATIAAHLQQRRGDSPAVSTIWRILVRARLRHPPTAQTPQKQLYPLPGRTAQRTLATRHHPLATRRQHRRRDPQHPRRPLPAVRRQRHPPGVQGQRRQHQLHQSRCRLWRSSQPAQRQRGRLHRPLPRHRPSRPRSHPAQPRYQLPPLPAPTIPKPAARSNASTKPSKNGSATRPRAHTVDANYKPSSTPSVPTTTPCAHTAHSAGAPHNRPTSPAPKQPRPAPHYTPAPTASATTASTATASSPCATTAASTTSGWAADTPAQTS